MLHWDGKHQKKNLIYLVEMLPFKQLTVLIAGKPVKSNETKKTEDFYINLLKVNKKMRMKGKRDCFLQEFDRP